MDKVISVYNKAKHDSLPSISFLLGCITFEFTDLHVHAVSCSYTCTATTFSRNCFRSQPYAWTNANWIGLNLFLIKIGIFVIALINQSSL